MTAKSRSSRQRSASSPDERAHEPLAERLEDRLEREEVLRPVVDEQNVDAVVFDGASSALRSRRGHGAERTRASSQISRDASATRASGTHASAAARHRGTLGGGRQPGRVQVRRDRRCAADLARRRCSRR